jgi:tetratricopeptide (TPR) repeat protein
VFSLAVKTAICIRFSETLTVQRVPYFPHSFSRLTHILANTLTANSVIEGVVVTTQPAFELKSMRASQPVFAPKELRVPSCLEIGLQASKKGDFTTARQMLRSAIEQLVAEGAKQPGLIELTTNIADTYFKEGRHDSAKIWYAKALRNCEFFYGTHTLHTACLQARLAEISVLQSDLGEFHRYFDHLQSAYLRSGETDVSALLEALIDLSWSLCLQGHLPEVQTVNALISQIKRLEEEDRLGMEVA